MLSHKVLTRQDIARAASYHEDAADDYYAKEGEASEWQGRGADTLGLSGPVESQRFRELPGGRVHPPLRGAVSAAAAAMMDSWTPVPMPLRTMPRALDGNDDPGRHPSTHWDADPGIASRKLQRAPKAEGAYGIMLM